MWPTVNIEAIMETDNSPITGIHGFNQNLLVFKNDSLWQMVDAGDSDAGLMTFVPERIPGAVGSVSNSSIVEVNGRIVFLAEDGLYSFSGQGEPAKVSIDPETGADRLVEVYSRITPGRRPFTTAVNWKTQGVYLLSVSLDGSGANNHVLAWDYQKNTFWLWDDIEAQTWMLDEDAADNERLYFIDSAGRVFELGVGKTSNGAAIEAVTFTHRLGRKFDSSTLREVKIVSRNTAEAIGVTVLTNDEPTGVTGEIDFTSDAEAVYDTGVYGTATWVADRRRERRIGFRRTGDWHQLKLTHSEHNVRFDLAKLDVGLVPRGAR